MNKRLKKKLEMDTKSSIEAKLVIESETDNLEEQYKKVISTEKRAKLNLANRLYNAYTKEEYLLLDIMRLQNSVEELKNDNSMASELKLKNTQYENLIIELRSSKIDMATKLFESYTKEEKMLYSSANLIRNKINLEGEMEKLATALENAKVEYQDSKNENEVLRGEVKLIRDCLEKNQKLIDELKCNYKNQNIENIDLEKLVQNLHVEVSNLKSENKKISQINKGYIEQIIKLKAEKIDASHKLLNSFLKEETLLKTYLKLFKEKVLLEKRYNSLKESKLGKVTMWYWKKRKDVVG